MEAKIAIKNLGKRKIKLSKKEKNLLILLALVILYWLLYKFVFSIQLAKLSELKQERDTYKEELLKIDSILSKDEAIDSEWAKMNREVEGINKKYFPTIEQPEIMHMLNEIIDYNSLKIPGMYFNGPDYATLDGIEAKYLGISIPFEGRYNELGVFLSQLGKSPKRFLVNQLTMSKNDDSILSGEINLNTYSYDEIINSTGDSAYRAEVQKVIKEDPFKPYDGYIEESEEEFYEENDIDTEKRTVLEEFENEELYFMSTSTDVTGKVSKFSSSKHGKYSLRTEYFISTGIKEERAYVLLDDKEIYLKYPPSSIGIWVHSYGYSPVTLGFRFQDQEGNKIDLELTKGINWTGWEYVEAMPPQDIKVYPLKLDRIYIELEANRDDYGVILFDNLEVTYPKNEIEVEKDNKAYTFYIVEYGDTFESISEKMYGTKSKYKVIMKQNGISSNSDLEFGQILVIPN
ncbi:LysM peptidoglycan-binding domain-containing protein [Proteiniborus sp.]|uniref:LysM peptidoglycan-binding domain-containing protein n=1 Tax=Proteiniborus sp. TaxID=2079015 RepID=UPI00332716F2